MADSPWKGIVSLFKGMQTFCFHSYRNHK